jgi:hypothetical protein
MKTYGFPWPTMLDCDKFPLDNDMCISSQSDKEADGKSTKLKFSHQPPRADALFTKPTCIFYKVLEIFFCDMHTIF